MDDDVLKSISSKAQMFDALISVAITFWKVGYNERASMGDTNLTSEEAWKVSKAKARLDKKYGE